MLILISEKNAIESLISSFQNLSTSFGPGITS